MAIAGSPSGVPADIFAGNAFRLAGSTTRSDLAKISYRILEPMIVELGKKYPPMLLLSGVGSKAVMASAKSSVPQQTLQAICRSGADCWYLAIPRN